MNLQGTVKINYHDFCDDAYFLIPNDYSDYIKFFWFYTFLSDMLDTQKDL